MHKRIVNLHGKVFRSDSSSEGRDFMYQKHIEASHVVVDHDRKSLTLKTSFSDLHTNRSKSKSKY